MQAISTLSGANAPVAGTTQYDLRARVSQGVHRAAGALIADQRPDGHWCYPLEADCTIPAEYVLMMHYMDEVDVPLQEKIARYVRARQGADGGWALYPGGCSDLSCTVKAYYALKLTGDDPADAHMGRARAWTLSQGGIPRTNVLTRMTLALFGQVPWRAVPYMPVELLLLPAWFPFHIGRVSYWSRTVIVPLFVLTALKPCAKNPTGTGVRELFVEPADFEDVDYDPVRSPLNRVSLALDAIGRRADRWIPGFVRQRALAKAERWILDRLNGSGGLGGIFPAMVNAHEALAALGHGEESPLLRQTRDALRGLLVDQGDCAFCQPSLSPVWDTALALAALREAGRPASEITSRPDSTEAEHPLHLPELTRGLRWLANRQLRDEPGDWRGRHPGLSGGGWPFQYENGHYPDLDDTALIAYLLRSSGHEEFQDTAERALRWIVGMQSKNGGFASFDSDNTYHYLNEIPFADHGALLDPPTSDVSGRCLMLMGAFVDDAERARGGGCDSRAHLAHALSRTLAFLRREQEEDGSWFGRWGTNYVYGTWSALMGMEAARVPNRDPAMRRAVAWLKAVQQEDGGWGESNDSYALDTPAEAEPPIGFTSTATQTAWALLGLMATGEAQSPEVERGVHYLLANQNADGFWNDAVFNAPGFPRVFYLKYHGYDKYFPLWALARYRRFIASV